VLGVLVGALQAAAIEGWPRGRRLSWALSTALGVWLAFPLGLITGILIAFGASVLVGAAGGASSSNSPWPVIIGVVAGGAVGGALVAVMQSTLVASRAAWLRRSVVGGMLVVPTTLLVLYGTALTGCSAQPVPGAVIGALSGVAYALVTFGASPASNAGTPAATA
jgi:hypothetical protein